MIEGNLSDVSLPGLLQFLATESNKSFRVNLVSGGQKGDLLVCEGEILSANYGLLEGNDALTELLFWPEGSFSVVLLNVDEKNSLAGNLKIALKQVNTFADQMLFLRESAVGLNSEIVPSLTFGTQAWQEALARQPLFKEDYAVLGWITDGRTMRQAMREFSFDVVRATSSLYRLLVTGSVEILRPTLVVEEGGGEIPLSGLAAILDSMQPAEDGGETFDASPQAAEGNPFVQQDPVPALEALMDAAAGAVAETPPAPAVTDGKDKSAAKAEPRPHSVIEPAPVAASRLVKNLELAPQSDVGTTTGATFNAVGGTMELSAPVAPLNTNGDRDVITSDALPAVGSAEFNEIMAKAQKASEEPVDVNAAPSQAVTTQIHLPTSFRTSSDKIPVVTAPLTPESLPIATAAAMARQTVELETAKVALSAVSATAAAAAASAPSQTSATSSAPTADSASAWAAAVREESQPAQQSMPQPVPQTGPQIIPQPNGAAEESPERRLFDIVRTDPLPIVAIDIERLFQTSFHVSPFGHISLGNDVLDADLQKILQDFKMGKNFITVATEEQMLPAQVLHYCKYCLERGYIDPPDAVASLTADLLLGRVELEQYLLQRRRITGDELRDVIEVAKQKGYKLTDLLVKLGFMTASDWDRLCQEKERFARR